jgi:hypothetical protein
MPGPDSKNPSPNDVTKDIASRLKTDGNPGFAELDVQSPGARPGVPCTSRVPAGFFGQARTGSVLTEGAVVRSRSPMFAENERGWSTVIPDDSVDILRRT